jgi:hypothetical protein
MLAQGLLRRQRQLICKIIVEKSSMIAPIRFQRL